MVSVLVNRCYNPCSLHGIAFFLYVHYQYNIIYIYIERERERIFS